MVLGQDDPQAVGQRGDLILELRGVDGRRERRHEDSREQNQEPKTGHVSMIGGFSGSQTGILR